MSCTLEFLSNIITKGINPEAYNVLVEYTINTLRPASNTFANAFVQLATDISTSLMLSVLILIFIVIILIVIILLSKGYIYPVSAICIIIVAAAILAIYYSIGYIYSKQTNQSISAPLQEDLSETVLLTINSIFRDILYLSTCR
jgi:hypothetical protein